MTGTPIRLVDVRPDGRPRVLRQFVTDWSCDPCAPADRRFRVRHPAGWLEHPWYAVIVVAADDLRTRVAKYQAMRRILELRRRIDGLTRELRALGG